jgi:hypothetical protein
MGCSLQYLLPFPKRHFAFIPQVLRYGNFIRPRGIFSCHFRHQERTSYWGNIMCVSWLTDNRPQSVNFKLSINVGQKQFFFFQPRERVLQSHHYYWKFHTLNSSVKKYLILVMTVVNTVHSICMLVHECVGVPDEIK